MRNFIILLALVVVVPFPTLAQNAPSTSTTSTIKNDRPARAALKFTRTLSKGMKGNDIQALQAYLKLLPDIYPDGSVTGYFGNTTETAIKKLQAREGLVNPTTAGKEYGAVGPQTLAKINALVARGSTPKPIPPKSTTEMTKPTLATTSLPTSPPPATTTRATPPPALPVRDTKPPIRSQGSPVNTLPITTTQVKISLTTDEPARCYWSNTLNTFYDSMATSFSTTGSTTHSFILSPVPIGDYAFFVKCRDRVANTNTSDYPIVFSVEHRYSDRDDNVPRVFMSFPTDGDTMIEGPVTLSAAAADNGRVVDVNFFLNSQNLNAEDTTAPFAIRVMLTPGSYDVFAVARDEYGNRATSTKAAFSVTAKPQASTQSTSATYAFSGPTTPILISLILPHTLFSPLNPNLAAAAYTWPTLFKFFSKFLR